jgi:ribose transport system substrate-binding protein
MKKRSELLVMCLLVMCFFIACPAKQAARTENARPVFAVICQALNSEYWNGFAQGARDAAAEIGFDVIINGPMAETMVTEQIAMIEAEISKGCDALLVAANQPSSIKAVFEQAKRAGIPVLEVDVESEWEGRSGYVGAGNYEGGYKAGQWFNENLPEGSQIAIIRGLLGDPTHDLRVNGCLDALKDGGKNISAVTNQPANSERGIAINVMENILQANPNIRGAFCSNDEMALGALRAAEGAKKDVKIIGFDGNMDALESIAAGRLAATISCAGYDVAYLAVITMKEIVVDKKTLADQRVLLDPVCVDSRNVEENIRQMTVITQKVEQFNRK